MPFFFRTFLLSAMVVSTVPALETPHPDGNQASANAASGSLDTAIFAGGSFWCLEEVFEAMPGVVSVTAGYTLGQGSGVPGPAGKGPAGQSPAEQVPAPDFESVSAGNSAYVEAVRVIFRPKRIAYAKLLESFWKNIDPTRADGQFSDEGAQYRTIVFHFNEDQRKVAESSRKKLVRSKRFAKPILTGIAPATAFYDAEPEHQDYYKRNAARYRAYVRFSGREAFFKKAWGGNGGTAGPK